MAERGIENGASQAAAEAAHQMNVHIREPRVAVAAT